jgi:hypothetical protein
MSAAPADVPTSASQVAASKRKNWPRIAHSSQKMAGSTAGKAARCYREILARRSVSDRGSVHLRVPSTTLSSDASRACRNGLSPQWMLWNSVMVAGSSLPGYEPSAFRLCLRPFGSPCAFHGMELPSVSRAQVRGPVVATSRRHFPSRSEIHGRTGQPTGCTQKRLQGWPPPGSEDRTFCTDLCNVMSSERGRACRKSCPEIRRWAVGAAGWGAQLGILRCLSDSIVW